MGDDGSVDQLVGDVTSIASDLTSIASTPAAADVDEPARAAEDAPTKLDRADAATKPLADGIEQVTTIAAQLRAADALPVDPSTAIAAPASLTIAPDGAGTPSVADAFGDPADAAGSTSTRTPDVGTYGADRPSTADAATTSRDRRTHVAAAAAPADGFGADAAGDGGAGDGPVQPFPPRVLTSSTTSSPSAGGHAFDGGAGARLIDFHAPYAARSVAMPAVAAVDVPWNPAGKPRVSPD